MFHRKPKVAPIGISQMAWPLAQDTLDEEVQRMADKRGYDLKTPLGQFKAFQTLAGPQAAARYFRFAVIVRIAELDWFDLQKEFSEFNVTRITHGFDEGAPMLALLIDGSLLDWYRLRNNNDEDVAWILDRVREAITPTKLWSNLTRCSNVY